MKLLRIIRRSLWVLTVLCVGVLAFKIWRQSSDVPTAATRVEDRKLVPDVSLLDADDQAVPLSKFLGKWVIVFFGFRSCPDVCPTTMRYLSDELKTMNPEDRERLEVVFISVDLERDRGPAVAEFAKFFSISFNGFVAEPDQMLQLNKFFGVYSNKREHAASKTVAYDHSPDIFVLDNFGRWRLLLRPPLHRGALAHDLHLEMTQPADFVVSDAWVRQPAGQMSMTGAFLGIQNLSTAADELTGIQTSAAETTEIHETSIDAAGMSQMLKKDMVPIPAKGRAELAPGGAHAMLLDLKQPLKPGQRVPLTLRFAKAGQIRVSAEIRAQ